MTANQTKILKSALLDFALSKVDYYESLDIKEPSYSDNFKNKITELSRRKNSSKSKRITFILIAAVITVLLIVSASAVALKFGDYIVDVYEKYIEVHSSSQAKNTISQIHSPSYIPKGYEPLSETSAFDVAHTYTWTNGKNTLILDQNTLSNGGSTLDNESLEYQSFVLDGKIVYYYTKYNTSIYTWSLDEYVFTINAPANISIEEIKMMISSMETAEK